MNFTHRTTRPIGNIKAGTPIRVAQYTLKTFKDVLDELGDDTDISYVTGPGDPVLVMDGTTGYEFQVYLKDYVITDGTQLAATGVDTGFELLQEEENIGTFLENFSIDQKDYKVILNGGVDKGEYVLGTYGEDGRYVPAPAILSEKELHDLAEYITENIPKPAPLEDHLFIWGTPANGPREPLVRDGEFWYDSANVGYTTREVHELYTDLEVIR